MKLTQLNLQHFKCFKNLDLALGSLTLLTGLNSSGKSSIIQSLCLIHQSIWENEWNCHLQLNGNLLQMGQTVDLMNDLYGRDCVKIGLSQPNCTISWDFDAGDRTSNNLPIREFHCGNSAQELTRVPHENLFHHFVPKTLDLSFPAQATFVKDITLKIAQLNYISAERLGPRDTYPIPSDPNDHGIGALGEFAPWQIFTHKDTPISSSLTLPDHTKTFYHQTRARFKQFFPGWSFTVERLSRTNRISLLFEVGGSTRRPCNVGFGLSQVLPIICTCLLIKPEQLLLIENPETHLHPRGQAEMGYFLAQTAAAGAQLIIESHSDHVLNGIRLAVREGVLPPDQTKIHFFRPIPQTESESQVLSPSIDSEGKLDSTPNGFFDQIENDLLKLAGWA